MKVSLNWLREFVDFAQDAAALSELLTLAGVEVEGIEARGVAIDKVVVAKILDSKPHPNADRLSVCQVDDGAGQPRQIVCGAKNYKVGDKVPLAQPGAVLPGDPSTGSGQGFKIKVGKLRGVDSEGMLCSAKELRLAEDAEGLLILPESAQVGASLATLYPADTILDLEVTPNRPDLLSHIGIAREVAALTGRGLKTPVIPPAAEKSGGTIQLDAMEQCPYYTARRISGVKVGASPEWLRLKLQAVGLRPINNVVDVTNFVMLEMGQPLHAFDAGKLQGGIRVRMAHEGEEFLALDGQTYKLQSDNLVVADARHAIAIAGVMGGEETGVTEATTNIILESAYFQPSSVRRTSRKLGLVSDSSYRFERGVDDSGVAAASRRAAELILRVAGGTVDGFTEAGKIETSERVVALRDARCAQLLGVEISAARIEGILTSLGLGKTSAGWRIPSYRQDLTREIDLIEEVSRVFGIENVPDREMGRFAAASDSDRFHDRGMKLRTLLAGQGFSEARTLTLISGKALARQFFAAENPLRVRNPLNEDQVVLRPGLLPGLLGALENNVRVGAKNIRLYELGRVFGGVEGEEQTHLGFVMTGAVEIASWRAAKPRDADLFDLKGVLSALGIGRLDFRRVENPALAVAVEIFFAEKCIGHAGQVRPSLAREMDVATPVLVAEINLSAVEALDSLKRKFAELDKYPAVTRDVAMLVPLATPHAQIVGILQDAGEPLLASVELFDVFSDATGGKIAVDRKSLAYSLTYRAKDRTLQTEEVNAAHERLKGRLKGALDVQFRE
jgi:phenylalanyl-tRNA synthetase beta chain